MKSCAVTQMKCHYRAQENFLQVYYPKLEYQHYPRFNSAQDGQEDTLENTETTFMHWNQSLRKA